jgi:hypothetical protein
MQNKLELYHKILPAIFIPICLYAIIAFGWIGFATFTGRPGLYGHYYIYYQLTDIQFFLYNFIVAIVAAGLVIFQTKYLIQQNPKYLTRTFWVFAIFMALVIICENYLKTRFVGKG